LIASLSLPPHRTRIAEVPSPPPLFVLACVAAAEPKADERSAPARFVAYILHFTGIREKTLEPWASYGSPPEQPSRPLDGMPLCSVCRKSFELLFSRDAELLRHMNPFEDFRCAQHLELLTPLSGVTGAPTS
jgi:hypothetical protein